MKILTASQIKSSEQEWSAENGNSLKDLMPRAAEGLFKAIEDLISFSNRICIVCGKGNNGGDGMVLSGLLAENGYQVTVYFPFGEPVSFPAVDFLPVSSEVTVASEFPKDCDVLIDALFGIGLSRPLEGEIAETVKKMNSLKALKIAVDVPSGVNADGKFADNAFKADKTFTFIALKSCFVLPETSGYCGDVKVIDIGVEPYEYAYLTIEPPVLKKRNRNSHKGDYGTALMLTGSYGMCGASVLAAKGALATGVGLLKSFVCDKNYTAFTVSVPEAVTIPTDTLLSGTPDVYDRMLLSEFTKADAFLIGCGLNNSEDSVNLVKRALSITNVPTVIDADGINALSGNIEFLKRVKAPVVLTPHPKEMSRLVGANVSDIQSNRPEFAKHIAVKYNCTVVLKGANTVVATKDGRVYFNMTGNAGMATGGSGDVLAGMITAFIAMGYSVEDSAKNAVWLHGFAGDLAAEHNNINSVIPSDIIYELKKIKL